VAVGVRAFSTYIPWLRLPGQAMGNARPLARSVAGWDETALTLAVEAAVPLAEGHRAAKAALSSVLFASAHSTHGEIASAQLASACDVPLERLRTTDLTASPRAGVQAMLAALDRLRGDRESADALVGIADQHAASVAGAGDAGAALVLGRAALVAELLGTHSVTVDPADVVQVGGDPAFVPTARAAIAGALTNANVQIADVVHFAIGAPSTAAALALMKAAGADASRLAPLFDDVIGHTGAAQPLLSFATALESSKPGDIVVLAAWGGGADALVFRTTSVAAKPARSLAAMIERSRVSAPQDTRLTAKHAAPGLRLHGAKCRHCDAIRFPADGACPTCTREGADPVRLGRTGTVVSVERDACVVDLDGGGRVSLQTTDVDTAAPLSVGKAVELGLRWSSPSYAWKARPVRA